MTTSDDAQAAADQAAQAAAEAQVAAEAAMKKAQEAGGMVSRQQYEAARAELLGAINYLAAAYILIGEIAAKQDVDTGSD